MILWITLNLYKVGKSTAEAVRMSVTFGIRAQISVFGEGRDRVSRSSGCVQAPLPHLCSPGRRKQLDQLRTVPPLPQQLSLESQEMEKRRNQLQLEDLLMLPAVQQTQLVIFIFVHLLKPSSSLSSDLPENVCHHSGPVPLPGLLSHLQAQADHPVEAELSRGLVPEPGHQSAVEHFLHVDTCLHCRP